MNKLYSFELKSPPSFTSEQIEECKTEDNLLPLLFEFQRSTVIAIITCAQLRPESPGIKKISKIHFAVLAALLNRCCRLSLAVNNLGAGGLFGETTRLLMRSIIESSIKARWLIKMNSDEQFRIFLSDGLKKEIMMREEIRSNVERRGGKSLVIEDRMLSFSQRFFDAPQLSEEEVRVAKPLRDLASMCRDLELNDLFYLAIQRIGSHSVHGTWPDLYTYYLKHEDDAFHVEDHNARMSENELLYTCDFMLAAADDFLVYVGNAEDEISRARAKIEEHRNLVSQFHDILGYRDEPNYNANKPD
jgi:hypothetical protein